MIRLLTYLLSVTFCLSACFDISDKIEFRANGSGTYVRKFDFTPTLEHQGISGLSDSARTIALRNLNMILLSEKEKWMKTPGIHNMSLSPAPDSLKYTLTFDFDHTEALNTLFRLKKDSLAETGNYFSYKTNKFTFEGGVPGVLGSDQGGGEYTKQFYTRSWMSACSYDLTVTLPGIIKSSSNPNYEILKDDPKTINFITDHDEIMTQNNTGKTAIKFK